MAYTADSIVTKENLFAVRAAAGMYVGEGGAFALRQILKEPVDNVVDEFSVGRCDSLLVYVNQKNHVYLIADDGPGIPKAKLRDAVERLHTSGKFRDAGGYVSSEGTNGAHGVGVKVTNAMSKRFVALSSAGGSTRRVEFKAAKFVADTEYDSMEDTPEATMLSYCEFMHTTGIGTAIVYQPDFQQLNDGVPVGLAYNDVSDWLETLSMFNPGLAVTLLWVDTEGELTERFYQFDSVNDYVDVNAERLGHEVTNPVFSYDSATLTTAFTCVPVQTSSAFSAYVNSSLTVHSGSLQLVGFRKALHDALQPYLKGKASFTPAAVQFNLLGAINARVKYPRYSGQTKEKLVSKDVDKQVYEELFPELEAFFAKNKGFAALLVRQATAFTAAQDSAKELTDAKKKYADLTSTTKKLQKSLTKNPEERELFIVEGESAGGNCKVARDRQYQEVHLLTGKFKNACRSKKSALLASKAPALLIQNLFGSVQNMEEGKLRVGKVMLTADADVDGNHIATLLHALLHTYAPNVYAEGRVFQVCTPLYKAAYKSVQVYGDSVEDVDRQLKANKVPKSANVVYTRFKGLGEMDTDALERTIFNPQTRRLRRITPPSQQEALRFQMLMGTDPAYRKAMFGLDGELDD